jgi:glucose-6-phosphate isomerase
MDNILFDCSNTGNFIAEHELKYMKPKVKEAHDILTGFEGPGREFTDWLELPLNHNKEEFAKIKQISTKIKNMADTLIVIGIGGSYLGARSALEMLNHNDMEVYFAGNNMSSTYLASLLNKVKDKEIVINVISKSGKTLEPALAFRIFKKLLEEKYGKNEAGKRIIATTDKEKGALRKLADNEGYETFIVPDGIGGRYSVLTPVGLLPMAAGGIDIDEVMEGAKRGYFEYKDEDIDNNISYKYAAVRNILYTKGKTLELLVNYEPRLYFFAEWWKQLFGESEGKDGK